MTITSMVTGMLYPQVMPSIYGLSNTFSTIGGNSVETALATAADKLALIGYAKVDGRATGKVLSAAGGGSIMWRTGTVTWANGGTTMDIGVQGVNSTSAGPQPQPDGTYTVKRTLTGGDGNITTSATKTTAMTGGSGTVTINHGDLISVVFDMTARAGADSVIINSGTSLSSGGGPPSTNLFTAAAWKTSGTTNRLPNILITSDDGTLITFEETSTTISTSNETFTDATNPDERGLIFQIPWDCKVDGIWALFGSTDTSSQAILSLYTDPLGTPATAGTVYTIEGEFMAISASDRYRFFPFATEVSLTAATDYVVAIKAGGSSNTRLPCTTLFSAASRALNVGGTTVAKVTRNNSAGAFSAEVTPVTMYAMGVRISGVNVTSTASTIRTYQA